LKHLSGRQLILYGLVILIIGIVIGSVSLTYPFGRDQAFYAYAGKLLLEGKMNYLNVFDLKPPGSHLFFAFTQILFGESMFNARVSDLLWQSSTAFIIFLIVFRLTLKKSVSLAASFIYLFLYYRQDYWHTMQADGMLNLPFALCVLLLILSYSEHSFIKIYLSGILFALALMFKYTVISFLPLVVICFLISANDLKSIRIKNIFVFLFGTISLCGAAALWY
jgi:4-amino-4-deoxy-L-arabinose transferase-like glycosyltransferase